MKTKTFFVCYEYSAPGRSMEKTNTEFIWNGTGRFTNAMYEHIAHRHCDFYPTAFNPLSVVMERAVIVSVCMIDVYI